MFVGSSYLDFGEAREDVEFGQVDGGESVDEGGVFHLGNVEPSDPSGATGGGSPFGAYDSEVFADGAGFFFSSRWSRLKVSEK